MCSQPVHLEKIDITPKISCRKKRFTFNVGDFLGRDRGGVDHRDVDAVPRISRQVLEVQIQRDSNRRRLNTGPDSEVP